MLKAGDPVPDFAFASETFGAISSRSLRGKRYVLYFYPKDDTPGCTREACAFRDNLPKFAGAGVQVFGVSADDEKSHIRFSRKHLLPFKLIPDPDHVICERFGTWIEKSMYGRSYMGVARTTFVIAADGQIERIWEKVAPDGHAEEVLAWLNGETQPSTASALARSKPSTPAPPARAAPGSSAAVQSAAVKSGVAALVAKPAARKTPASPPAKTQPAKSRQTATPATAPARPQPSTAKSGQRATTPTAKKTAAAPKQTAKPAARKPAAKPTKSSRSAPAKPAARPAKSSKVAPAKKVAKAAGRKSTPAARKPATVSKARR